MSGPFGEKINISSLSDILEGDGEAVIYYKDRNDDSVGLPVVIGVNYGKTSNLPPKNIPLRGLWIDKTAYLLDLGEKKLMTASGYRRLAVNTDQIPNSKKYLLEEGNWGQWLDQFLRKGYKLEKYE
ncbi:MAG TPA: hypothetical protein VEC16_06745 [Alphaproteobacteria bacterium]|nr:hypothetical protein [Alphaproteobacteria bacterium]